MRGSFTLNDCPVYLIYKPFVLVTREMHMSRRTVNVRALHKRYDNSRNKGHGETNVRFIAGVTLFLCHFYPSFVRIDL